MIEALVGAAPHLWLAYAFAVGAVVGSFLNVVIARVPRGESIVHPGSRCPRCLQPIAWFDNLPILSWIVLRARCRRCALPISMRYPIVEALMGVLAIAIARQFGPTLAGLGYFLCAAALVSLAYIDLDTWLLPSELTLPLLGLGLFSPLWNQALALPLAGFFPGLRPLLIAFISSSGGALAGGLFLAAIAFLGERLGREWMGWGDVWLLAGIGAWLGLPALLPVMMLASVQGALVGMVLLAAGKALGARKDESRFEPEGAADKSVGQQRSAAEASAIDGGDTAARGGVASGDVASGGNPGSAEGRDAGTGAAAEEEFPGQDEEWIPPATAVPFGPFLVLAALEQMLVGERLWSAWMNLIARIA